MCHPFPATARSPEDRWPPNPLPSHGHLPRLSLARMRTPSDPWRAARAEAGGELARLLFPPTIRRPPRRTLAPARVAPTRIGAGSEWFPERDRRRDATGRRSVPEATGIPVQARQKG